MQKIVTRIWRGYKEYQSKPYFVGQSRINNGRLAGCYQNVTNEYADKDLTEQMLLEWEHEQNNKE